MTERDRKIDLQQKDGDPAKRDYVVDLLGRHRKTVIRVWRKFGIDRQTTINAEQAENDRNAGHTVRAVSESEQAFTRRMHTAPEHMVAATAAGSAIGEMLRERGVLDKGHVLEIEEALLVHDAGKELEVRLVNAARKAPGTSEINAELSNEYIDVNNKNLKINQKGALTRIKQRYAKMFNSPDEGTRAIAGYDMASDVNELRLRAQGVRDRVIKIQKEVAFTSCPTIDKRISQYPSETNRGERALTTQMAVAHWCDDTHTNDKMNPDIVEEGGQRLNAIDTRTIAVFKIPRNKVLDEAWRSDFRSRNGEGAADMQRRVGHNVERFLARLAGVEDSLTLPAVVSSQIEENILNH